MAFDSLPRELRDKIYEELLTRPTEVFFKTSYDLRKSAHPRPWSPWFDTALLYANHQISNEAAKVLYSSNVFALPSPLTHFVKWLLRLPPRHRQSIRKLKIPQRLLMPLLFNNIGAWKQVYDIIGGRSPDCVSAPMQLHEVVIEVPLDFQLYEPSPALGLRKLLTNSEQFWWPAVKFFMSLLMEPSSVPATSEANNGVSEASLARLILKYPTFDNRGIPASHTPVFKPLLGPQAVDIETLEAVRMLRVPRQHPEDVGAEDEVLTKMMRSGTRGSDTKNAWREYHEMDTIRARDKWDFHVNWMAGAEGSHLIVTR